MKNSKGPIILRVISIVAGLICAIPFGVVGLFPLICGIAGLVNKKSSKALNIVCIIVGLIGIAIIVVSTILVATGQIQPKQ